MDTIFLTFMEQKCCLEQLKLGLRSVKMKRSKNSKVTGMENGKKKKKKHAHQTDEMWARVPRRPAYLPLQHQLFGEQHGLVTERFRHLHSSGRIPGTAWTFDTCGRHRRKSKVSTAAAAANHDSGRGSRKAPTLSGFQKLKRSFTDTCVWSQK